MKRIIIVAVLALGVGLGAASVYANCGHCGGDKAKKEEHAWCSKCGETDKEKCCKDATKCEKCGLHKDSPGCKHQCAAKTCTKTCESK